MPSTRVKYAKNTRKKLNKKRIAAKRAARRSACAIGSIRSALQGITLSYNSSWGTEAQLHPSEVTTALKKIGCSETLAQLLEQWPFNWEVVATVYCSGGQDFDQPATATLSGYTATEMGEHIEQNIIPRLKNLCNANSIVEWGFFAKLIH